MTFSKFAGLLKPIIGGSDNTAVFTRNLFTAIIGEENSIIIENYSDDSYKAYYNGRTSINKISKVILPYVDPENFYTYLNVNFSDSVTQKIFDNFSNYIEGLDLQNTNEKIAYFFDEIIKKAASTERKSTHKSAIEYEAIDLPSVQVTDSFPFIETDKDLLSEFNSDYDQIALNLISENYASYLIDMSIPTKIKELYQTKWKDKSNNFVDPTLKSYVFGLLGNFEELSSNFISCNPSTSLIKKQRQNIRNLYVKLHPENFVKDFPYDVFVDDWIDGEM